MWNKINQDKVRQGNSFDVGSDWKGDEHTTAAAAATTTTTTHTHTHNKVRTSLTKTFHPLSAPSSVEK